MTRSLVAFVSQFLMGHLHPSPNQTSLNGSYSAAGLGAGSSTSSFSAVGSSISTLASAFAFFDLGLDEATGGGGISTRGAGSDTLSAPDEAACARLCIFG